MKNQSLLFAALALFVIILSINALNPPSPVEKNAPDTSFSAQRAFVHIQQIAKAPHPVGTAEHERVRNYIVDVCTQLGLNPQVQHTTSLNNDSFSVTAAEIYNIIGVLKGNRAGKAVMIAAHYDSQPNTPGAGDDGLGVAAMLETARALKASGTFSNDVIFLFTDAEEIRMLGAKAFVKEHPMFKNVGVVMNWDCRGNAGVSVTYETNANNGWLMKHYAEAAEYPFGNSLGYEVSQLLPNYTDFTQFKNGGATGFANGLLGGFPQYHSMTDTPENLDLGSLQQMGSNMLSLAKRFGDVPLTDTRAPDLTYFNVLGFWFLTYPSSWNLFLAIITTGLFVFAFYAALTRKKVGIIGFAAASGALLLTLILSALLSFLLLKGILWAYPLYSHFYENNSYNSRWYFVAMTMLSLVVFSLIYSPLVRRFGYYSTFLGLLDVMLILTWVVYVLIPSATYLFSIPAIFLLLGYVWMVSQPEKTYRSVGHQSIGFLSSIPAMLLFAPLIYMIFLAFALGGTLPGVAILLVLAYACIYPVLAPVFLSHRWGLTWLAIAGLIFSLVMAHVRSGYDKDHPIKTNLRYVMSADDSSAVWISDFVVKDDFTSKVFTDDASDGRRHVEKAPVITHEAPELLIVADSSQGDEMVLVCRPNRPLVHAMQVEVVEGEMQLLSVNDKPVDGEVRLESLVFYGVPANGFEMRVRKGSSRVVMEVSDRSMGLPSIKGVTEFPEHVIPGPGFDNNTTQVRTTALL